MPEVIEIEPSGEQDGGGSSDEEGEEEDEELEVKKTGAKGGKTRVDNIKKPQTPERVLPKKRKNGKEKGIKPKIAESEQTESQEVEEIGVNGEGEQEDDKEEEEEAEEENKKPVKKTVKCSTLQRVLQRARSNVYRR